MPWTFAHPAAILPLRRLCPRWLSLPALILGSLAPDVSYYVGMHGQWRAYCHTIEGVVTACLPVCLLVLALLLRFAAPLTVLLPEPHRRLARDQLRPPPHAAWAGVAVLVASILIGAATHLLWDAVTHAVRWGGALAPVRGQPLWAALGRALDLTHPLQHVSTVVGVVVLAIAYRLALRKRPSAPHDPRRSHVLLACLGVAIGVGVVSAHLLTPVTMPGHMAHVLVRSIVWSTSCFTALFVVASAVWWRRLGDG